MLLAKGKRARRYRWPSISRPRSSEEIGGWGRGFVWCRDSRPVETRVLECTRCIELDRCGTPTGSARN